MLLSPATRRSIDQHVHNEVNGHQTSLPSLPNHNDNEDSSLEPPATDPAFTHASRDEVADISAVLDAFRLHKAGKLSRRLWQKFPLSPAGYGKLQEALQHDDDSDSSLNGYVEDKIRYDYFPYLQKLVIRMRIAIHELLIRDVVKEIMAQLESIGAGQSSSADFARHIIDWRHTDIGPKDPDYGKHSPDTSFGHD